MGERLAKDWFQRHKLDFHHWPQRKDNMPKSLKLRGGKRPDFSVDLGEELVHFDAKYQDTENLTAWGVEDEELGKFQVFREWFKDEYEDDGPREVVFILYPLELHGKRFVIIHLDEVLGGEQTIVRQKPGRKVSLVGRGDAWFDQSPNEMR